MDLELSTKVNDLISTLTFGNASNLLISSSWSGIVQLFDPIKDQNTYSIDIGRPLLCSCTNESNAVFVGGLDGTAHQVDVSLGNFAMIGSHSNAISCMNWCNKSNTLFTGGWDGYIRQWDHRTKLAINSIQLKDRIYSLSCSESNLVVATKGRHLEIYRDTNMLRDVTLHENRESLLKHQTRKVACMPSGSGYVIGSIEGRAAIDYFTDTSRSYTFKCHRKDDRAYPINAIAFHPTFGTFATGGSDGVVNIWDGDNKKRITALANYDGMSISALSFSPDGSMLAVATGYTCEESEKSISADSNTNSSSNSSSDYKIHIHSVQDSEVRPKQRAQISSTS